MPNPPNHCLADPTPAHANADGSPRSGPSLAHGLKQRHLSMIALGGVIGAGLFVGSGTGIAAAGPSIVLAYALSGVLVMLVMRMLGEMSAANPASGSFSVHAERAIGPWAGFTAGWMFWTLLCVGVGAEAIGAADIMTGWFPGTRTFSAENQNSNSPKLRTAARFVVQNAVMNSRTHSQDGVKEFTR